MPTRDTIMFLEVAHDLLEIMQTLSTSPRRFVALHSWHLWSILYHLYADSQMANKTPPAIEDHYLPYCCYFSDTLLLLLSPSSMTILFVFYIVLLDLSPVYVHAFENVWQRNVSFVPIATSPYVKSRARRLNCRSLIGRFYLWAELVASSSSDAVMSVVTLLIDLFVTVFVTPHVCYLVTLRVTFPVFLQYVCHHATLPSDS